MHDKKIIDGIRETRHAFAAKYGNDLRKIAAAADRVARDLGFTLTSHNCADTIPMSRMTMVSAKY